MDLSNLEVDVAHSGGIGQQISKAGLLVGQWNLGRGGWGVHWLFSIIVLALGRERFAGAWHCGDVSVIDGEQHQW